MRVYLDTNVLIDVFDERIANIGARIRESASNMTHQYPFSAAHISEVAFGPDEEGNHKRLTALSGISGDIYFAHTVHELGFKKASPHSVYKTLNEVPIAASTVVGLAQLIPHEEQKAGREALGLSSVELNNLSPEDAIIRIENTLASFQYPAGLEVKVPRSLSDFLELGRNIQRDTSASLWAQLNGNLEEMLRNNNLVCLFSLFDSFGFWSDDRSTYDKGSRFSDSQHAFNASHFEVLVSRDRRFRMKAKASYSYLGIKTIVQSPDEFVQSLR